MKKTLSKIANHVFGAWFPLTFLLIFSATWAFQVSRVGFYLDDYVYLSAWHQGGFEALKAYAFDDSRPGLLPYVIGLGFKLVGTSHFGWQVWSLFWRYLGGVGLWLLVRTVWPKRSETAIVGGILFALFPFFKHQAFAIAYNQIWIQGALIVFSFWLTVRSFRAGGFLFGVGAAILSLIQLFMTEYYLTIELGRVLLIYFVSTRDSETKRDSVRLTLKRFLPYALVLLVFGVLRFIVMPRFVVDRNGLEWMGEFDSPVSFLLYMFQMVMQYVTEAVWGIWYRSIRPNEFNFSMVSQQLGLVTAGAVFVVLILGLIGLRRGAMIFQRGDDSAELLTFGLVLTVLGFLPGMAIDKNPSTQFLYHDRFMIPAFLGLSILVPAALTHLVNGFAVQLVLAAVFCAISVNFQINNSYHYRNAWENQQDFQWQLYWRVPDLKPNTAILGDGIIASFLGNWADGGMILEMYGKRNGVNPTEYWYLVGGEGDFEHEFQNQMPLTKKVKIYDFRAEFGNNVVITKSEWDRCLWVLDDLDEMNPYLSPVTKNLIQYTNPSRIVYDSGWTLDEGVFGADYPKGWCYAYEKAGAAVAQQDYAQALAYYDEAVTEGWNPKKPVELTPFIRAAAHLGQWEAAAEMTERASWERHITWEYFRALWDELVTATPDSEARQEALDWVTSYINAP